MRVLLLFWGGGEGGDAAVVIELAHALKDRGEPATVVAYAMSFPDIFKAKAEAAGLSLGKDLYFTNAPGEFWEGTGLERVDFDLIHVHHGRAVPKRTDILPLKKAAGDLPLVLTAHGAPPLSSITYGGIKSKISRFISPVWFDAIVVPSEAKLREWKKMTPLSKNVFAIPNIVRFLKRSDRELARKAFGFDRNAEIILYCSRIEDEKDPLTFVRAMSELGSSRPNLLGVMAGGGAMADETQSLIDDLQAPVRMLGYVDNVSQLYSCADVFVQPSVFESFCITLLHAAAMGLPCVLSELEVFRDYYDHFSSFQWFALGDFAGCAAAVKNQLEQPPDTSAQLSLLERFSETAVITAHQDLWKKVVDKKWRKTVR